MQRIPRPLLVLHRDRTLREQLRSVSRSEGYQLRLLADWDELLNAVRAAPASSLLIVDPYAGASTNRDAELSTELLDLLNQFPSLTVTAATRVVAGRAEQLLTLGEWGVTQVVDLGEECTSSSIAHRLMTARGRPLRVLVERALPDSTSGSARAILSAATRVVAEGGQGKDLARSLHVTTRTLTRWCRRAALPPPKRLLAWMRVMLAAELLDDPGRTISDVALSCGYAADSSLRHALGRFLGRTPSDLRDLGAFSIASKAFLKALTEARSAGVRYRTPKA